MNMLLDFSFMAGNLWKERGCCRYCAAGAIETVLASATNARSLPIVADNASSAKNDENEDVAGGPLRQMRLKGEADDEDADRNGYDEEDDDDSSSSSWQSSPPSLPMGLA
mmetsp:Transcript_24737/g.59629  ORF Transcript_24737/g.59629 Transcript_24737/m.59629 type:complete len:110 (+) Transcript_24737:195-524(+)